MTQTWAVFLQEGQVLAGCLRLNLKCWLWCWTDLSVCPDTTSISRGNERKLIIVIENMGKTIILQQKQPLDAFKHDSSQTDICWVFLSICTSQICKFRIIISWKDQLFFFMRYSNNTAVGLNTCVVTDTMWSCFLKLKIKWDSEWDYKLLKQAGSRA